MRDFLKILTCIAALGLTTAPVLAQDTTAPATDPTATNGTAATGTATDGTTATGAATDGGAAPAADVAIPLGQDEETSNVGKTYVKSTHGDWELRCVHAPEGRKDPCQLYQLLTDGSGNSVAEISVFSLKNDKTVAAGATIVTPLETLLTKKLRLAVDGGTAKIYPFAWCTKAGCFARLGFTADDVTALKHGAKATVTIVPVAAANKEIALSVSLKGFTAGFDAMVAAEK